MIKPIDQLPRNKPKQMDPQVFLRQFDFCCKYNKSFNRQQDCTDYLLEIRKEILMTLEKQNTSISLLEIENQYLKTELEKLK